MSGLERVYVRNDRSRKVHIRLRNSDTKHLFSLESCNLDQSEDFTYLSDLRGVDLPDYCDHCFSSTDREREYQAEQDPEDAA